MFHPQTVNTGHTCLVALFQAVSSPASWLAEAVTNTSVPFMEVSGSSVLYVSRDLARHLRYARKSTDAEFESC